MIACSQAGARATNAEVPLNPEVAMGAPHAANQVAQTIDETHTRPHFALITIPAPDGWKPRNERSTPPNVIGGIDIDLLANLAVLFNASERAKARHRWAVVTDNGGFFILNEFPDEARPEEPSGLPDGCVRGLSRREAQDLAGSENEQAFRLSKCPRYWTIVIRDVGLELEYYRLNVAHKLNRDTTEPSPTENVACQEAAPIAPTANIARCSRSADFNGVHVALVHPSFGTLAVSRESFAYSDVDRILSEARPAIAISAGDRTNGGA